MERRLGLGLVFAAAWLTVVVELVLRDFENATLIVGLGLALTAALAVIARGLADDPSTGRVVASVIVVGAIALTPRIVRLVEDGDGIAWAALPVVVMAMVARWAIGWDRVGSFGEPSEVERAEALERHKAMQRSAPQGSRRKKRR